MTDGPTVRRFDRIGTDWIERAYLGATDYQQPLLPLADMVLPAGHFSPDSKLWVSRTLAGACGVWDLTQNTPRSLPVPPTPTGTIPLAVAGQRVILAEEHTLRLWQLGDPITASAQWPCPGLAHAAVTPGGDIVVTSAGLGAPPQTEPDGAITERWPFAMAEIDPRQLAAQALAPQHWLTAWDMTAAKPRPINRFRRPVGALAVHPSGNWVVLGRPQVLEIFRLSSSGLAFALSLTFSGRGQPQLDFSLDGDWLFLNRPGHARLYRWRDGHPERMPLPDDGKQLLLTSSMPDGSGILAVTLTGLVRVLDPTTGAERRRWQLPVPVAFARCVPDGQHLACANLDGSVYIVRLQE
jgi:hypothetical protein